MLRNGAKRAAAKAAAHDIDGVLDHLQRRNFCLAINRMRSALIGLLKNPIELGRGQGDRGRVEPNLTISVRLYQRQRVMRVGLLVHDSSGVRIQHRIVLDAFIAG